MVAMIGRMHHVALDCRDPAALAEFYSRLLGQPITYRSDDWVVVAANDTTSGLAFQLAPEHRPPTWPDPAVPQQNGTLPGRTAESIVRERAGQSGRRRW